jgi:hypothetical protein
MRRTTSAALASILAGAFALAVPGIPETASAAGPVALTAGTATVDGVRDAGYARVGQLSEAGKVSSDPGFTPVADVYMVYDPTACNGAGKLYVYAELLGGRTIDRNSDLLFFVDLNSDGKRGPGESVDLSGARYNTARTGVEFGTCYTCSATAGGVGFHFVYSNANERNAGRTARFIGAKDSTKVGLLLSCPAAGGPGSITIIKEVRCSSAFRPLDSYAFETTGSGLSGFELDGNGDGAQPTSKTFSNLNPGTYTVTETVKIGATVCAVGRLRDTPTTTVPSIICTDGGVASLTLQTDNGLTAIGTATITLTSGSDVTCTFVNVTYGDTTGGPGPGQIWITKTVQCDPEFNPLDFYTFTTTGTGLSTFVLDGDGDEAQLSTIFFSNLQPGTYSITESVRLGPTSCAIGQVEDESGNVIGPTITCEYGRGLGPLPGAGTLSFPDAVTVVGTATFTLPSDVGVACTFENVGLGDPPAP